MTKKIYAHLVGGFGNQCFIYAAARALALRYGDGRCVLIDTYGRKNLRNFALEGFQCIYDRQVFSSPIGIRFKAYQRRFWRRLADGLGRENIGNWYFDYNGLCPLVIEPKGHKVILDGYFQSEEMFEDIKEQIFEDFTLSDDAWIQTDDVARRILSTSKPIFLHARSYREVANGGNMCLPVSYYINGAKLLRERVGDGTVFLFSDDIQWAVENLEGRLRNLGFNVVPVLPNPTTAIHCDNQGFMRDFTLMRLCNHAIIPNSTFSWWAAWLMEHSRMRSGEKTFVVRPSTKRSGIVHDGRGMWPERWLVGIVC